MQQFVIEDYHRYTIHTVGELKAYLAAFGDDDAPIWGSETGKALGNPLIVYPAQGGTIVIRWREDEAAKGKS